MNLPICRSSLCVRAFWLLAAVLLFSCGADDYTSLKARVELNGDMEEADPVNANYALGWTLRAANFNAPNNYTYRRTDAFAASGQYSSMLKADDIDSPDEFWYLLQEIEPTDIPVGAPVSLSVKVKTVDLSGNGFEIALSGTHEFEPFSGIYRSSFDFTRHVQGDNDWQEYTLEVPAFPANMNRLRILLIISPNTTGEVYFDDVRLHYTTR